ncbi:MAG: hypothetical protein WCJ94_00215 [bacterium]
MKKVFVLFVFICLLTCGNIFAANAQDDDETPREFVVKGIAGGVSGAVETKDNIIGESVKQKIIQTGFLEKVSGDKCLLRKAQSKVEFYLSDKINIFNKNDGSLSDLTDRSYIDIRGPKNKKAALANTIYIYQNKKMFDEMTDSETSISKNSFQSPLAGTIIRNNVMVSNSDNVSGTAQIAFTVRTDDGLDYQILFDEDTIWVNNTVVTRRDLTVGDRLKLFFDKRLSIRYNNYPIKIIIDKTKKNI